MSEKKVRIMNAKDSTSNWNRANPILLDGELGFEVKSNNEVSMKVGNGNTDWKNLKSAYYTMSEIDTKDKALQNQIDNIVTSSTGTGDATAEVVQARVGADGTSYANLKERLDATDTTTSAEIEGLKDDFNNGETLKLYTDLSALTLSAKTGAANAYLHSMVFDKGYIEKITVHSGDAGTIKIYLYKLENNVFIPFEMYYKEAVKGENNITVNKVIDTEFYIAFASYNGAGVNYAQNSESAIKNTQYIVAGEQAENKFSGYYKFAISVKYGPMTKVWDYIENATHKKSLFLNTPDFALTSKLSTGAYNAYFVFDKFSKGFVNRIYVKGLESGSTTIILYRVSGSNYVPFRYYTKTIAAGENYIDVNEYIYCDFYIAISGKGAYVNKYVGTNNAKWIDINASIPTSTEPTGNYYFGVYFEYENKEVEKYKERIYNLQDAFMAWSSGKKFPVCFAGDSTTDGYQTTGYKANVIGTDHVLPHIYTKLLEDYLKAEIPTNSNLRIYNAGFSGKTAAWFNTNFNAEILENENYADTLMIGLSFGINDRPTNESQYNAVKSNFEEIIRKCYENGIQPFLLTCQAGLENSTRVSRREWITMSYANKIKYELADEYNLELIDVSKFTHNFITYSDVVGGEISADRCHFNDKGHQYEAGMFFAHLIPRVIWINGADKIGFDTYGLKSDLSSDANAASEIKMLDTITNGFKMRASAESTSDKIVMDIWVFVDSKNKLTLKSYCGNKYSQYIVVDGITYNLEHQEQEITGLDLGLHRITVHSGTGNINFYGFKLI